MLPSWALSERRLLMWWQRAGRTHTSQEINCSGPNNLNTQAEQNKGREPNGNISAGVPEHSFEPIRKGKANIDCCGDDNRREYARKHKI